MKNNNKTYGTIRYPSCMTLETNNIDDFTLIMILMEQYQNENEDKIRIDELPEYIVEEIMEEGQGGSMIERVENVRAEFRDSENLLIEMVLQWNGTNKKIHMPRHNAISIPVFRYVLMDTDSIHFDFSPKMKVLLVCGRLIPNDTTDM